MQEVHISSLGMKIDNIGNLDKDTFNLGIVFPVLLELQRQKGQLYGRSYCRHEHLSIFLNLERKWDRIANIMNMVMKNGTDTFLSEKSSTPTETVVDTVADLATYSLLWLGYISENHPEAFVKFLENNKLNLETCKHNAVKVLHVTEPITY